MDINRRDSAAVSYIFVQYQFRENNSVINYFQWSCEENILQSKKINTYIKIYVAGRCEAGMFHNKETGKCELCPAGQYQPEAGQTSCLSCPYLSALNRQGATKCPVPPGWFWPLTLISWNSFPMMTKINDLISD